MAVTSVKGKEGDTEATALLDGGPQSSSFAGRRLYARDRPGPSNSLSFFVAASFCINYVMGSGFLGLPAVFQEAGLVLSPVVLVVFMWLSDGTKDMLLEAMARWEALTRLRARRNAKRLAMADVRRLLRRGEAVPEALQKLASGPVRWRKRDFVVSHRRTFQLNELMLGLLGRSAEVAYMVGIALYLTGSMWGYSSVFSASFAANIPLPFLPAAPGAVAGACDVETDWAACAPHYHAFLALFACLAVPLACMEFREQAAVQVTMTVARVVVLFLLVGTVLGGLGCDGISFIGAPREHGEREAQARLASGPGLLRLLPVCLFAFIFHHSAPGVAEPVKDKRGLPGIFSAGFLVTGIGYLILATVAAFFFGASVKGQASLSWEGYVGCMPGHLSDEAALRDRSFWASAASAFILLFPALDVLSAFPLNAVTLANSLATATLPPAELVEVNEALEAQAAAAAEARAAARGRSWAGWLRQTCLCARAAAPFQPLVEHSATAHSAKPPPMVCCGLIRRGTAVRLGFRCLAAGVPIIGGAFVSDLGTILAWTGLVGVGIGLTVPAVLQIAARRRCEQELRRLWRERTDHEAAASPVPERGSPALGGDLEPGAPREAGAPATPAGLELKTPGGPGLVAAVTGSSNDDPVGAEGVRAGVSSARLGAGSGVEDDDGRDGVAEGRESEGAQVEGEEEGDTDGEDAEDGEEEDEEDEEEEDWLDGVEADDTVRLLAATEPAAAHLDALAVTKVLRTPFDHSVLARPAAAWAVVFFSGAMAIVVVIGLITSGQ